MLIDQFMNRTVFDLKRDRQALEESLRRAGCEHIRGSEVRCPFCEDNHPSAGIYETDGCFRYKCHACGFGGSIVDVISRADGLQVEEVLKRLRSDSDKPRGKNPHPFVSVQALKEAMLGTVEAVYQYTNPETNQPDMIVIRSQTDNGKTFRQARPCPGGYEMKAPDKPWPLYNRGRILQADTIVVVVAIDPIKFQDRAGMSSSLPLSRQRSQVLNQLLHATANDGIVKNAVVVL